MEIQPLDQVLRMARNKKAFLEDSLIKYIVRAALSGVFVGFGIILSFRLGEGFADVHSPVVSFMTSAFFGIALVTIIYGGAELFTGNTMVFTMSTLKKETSVRDLISNWIACYSGNLLGAIFFAVLIMLSGLLSLPENSQLLMSAAAAKIATPPLQLFFRAVLCNWVVCLAVWLPLHAKGDGAKIAIMMLLVFAFVASGFEHSVANMVIFATTLVIPHPDSITLIGAIQNLIPVTLGNIVGGGLFVGAAYVYLLSNVKKQKHVQYAEKTIA